MHRRIGALAVTGVVVLGTLTSGAALAQSPAAGGEAWRVGGGFALTGDEAALDVPANNGALLAVKEINAKGGVLGRQIDFIVHDSQYDMTVTDQIAKLAVEEDKVQAFIGYTDTDSVLASAPEFQTAGIPYITVGATSPKIPSQTGDEVFLAAFGDNVQAAAGAEYAKANFGPTAYLLSDKGVEYTTLLGQYFKDAFTAAGGHDRPRGRVRRQGHRLLCPDHQAQGPGDTARLLLHRRDALQRRPRGEAVPGCRPDRPHRRRRRL